MWSSPPPRNCRSCWACRCASTTVSKLTMSRRRCGRRYWMTSGDCSERGGWGTARGEGALRDDGGGLCGPRGRGTGEGFFTSETPAPCHACEGVVALRHVL